MALPIRLRLAIVCATLVAGLIVGLGALVYLRLEADMLAAADDGLLTRAEALASDTSDTPTLDVGPSDIGDIFAQLFGRDGVVVATTPGLAGDPLLAPGEAAGLQVARSFDAVVRTVDGPVIARLMAVPWSDGRVVVVGVSFDDQREALATLASQLALAVPIAVALAGGVGWLVAGAALRPVDRMRRESEAISGSDPGRRLAVPRTHDELADLGGSLNRMLARLEAAIERERRFVADASHELRTPLANLKAELDLAQRRARTPAELLDALRSATEETDRLTRLAEDLLVLASADGGRLPIRPEATDVAVLVNETVEGFAGRAASLGVALESVVEDGLWATLDGMRIRQAVGDLIDNALRHAGRDGTVKVDATRHDGALAISVVDTGDGFPPAFLQHAFEPFARADAARSRDAGGVGLGLAIVRAVADAHGGTVEALNRPEGGAVVEIRIPDR